MLKTNYLGDRYALRLPMQLALRLGLTLLIYTLSRLFFYAYNSDLLHIDSLDTLGAILLGGLRFDVSGVFYTNLLVIALSLIPHPWRFLRGYARAINISYWVCNIPMFLFNMSDVVYYRFTGRRTTLQVFDEFANENPLHFLGFFTQYWGVTLLGLGMIVLWIWLYNKTHLRGSYATPRAWCYYLYALLALCLMGVGVVFGMRGSLMRMTRPISPGHAAAYTKRPEQTAMVLNTPFVMIRTIGKHGLKPLRYMSEEEMTKLFDPVRMQATGDKRGLMQGRNVVIIIWESFAREWVGGLNKDIEGYEGYTPFIDSLLQRSYYWEYAYAGGGKSIDAMPAILASVPRPLTHFIGSPYASNRLSSLVEAVKSEGYHTAFFHNAPNGSMGFDAMARQLGFEQYYGKTEYNNDADYDGWWGIWDEPFLQFMVRTLGTFPQPFFASEFTTTSHSPYKLPEQYKERFPEEGGHPIKKSIRYTDYSLQQFFKEAEKQAWYENTLFVLVADHAVSGTLEEYKTSEGAYSIPIILFDPQGKLRGVDRDHVVQQADILPTLLSLLGIDYPIVAFGHNMLDPNEEHFAINALDNAYQMVRGDWILQYDGERVIGLYNRKADRLMKNNLKDSAPEVLDEMLPLMQAYLQSYTSRMIENRISIHPRERL